MAFSFVNAGQSTFSQLGASTGASGQSLKGQDLQIIQTEALSFLALAGESKVQLLPLRWPSDSLPPPTASLLSIASRRGLIAAAGPNVVIVATTVSVRKGFEGPKTDETQNRTFQAELNIPMNMRISQVVFTADENYLILSAEDGGGLAGYDVNNLLGGSTSATFEMSTNSTSLRALIPNPTPEKSEQLAVVTIDGKLMVANLRERSFVSGTNGQVLKNNVSCISWSAKGKQLVAGLGDGTAYQMTPEGVAKGEIPRPPGVDTNHHVSSITWLENNVFLMIHTPSSFEHDTVPASEFHLVTRQQSSNDCVFQKIVDPATPFGLNRSPPHHFLLRLRDFPPNLQDLLIVASTASTDIGMISRSKISLAIDKSAEQVTDVFTTTEMADDSRRAQLPMSEMVDTSPIGVALDLSSTEKVRRPILTDDIDESPAPLPALMVLNNEGVLAAWWVVYSDSIRQGDVYPGMIVAAGVQQPAVTQPPLAFSGPLSKPSFGLPVFGASASPALSGFSNPSVTAFGSTSSLGANPTSAFGAQSALNKTPSNWGSPSAGAVATTASSIGTPAFGGTSVPGARVSPWVSAGSQQRGATFGQPGGLGTSSKSQFGTPSTGFAFGSSSTVPVSGGFAAFANAGGFSSVPGTQGNSSSIFAAKPASNEFAASVGGSGMDLSTSFGGIKHTGSEKPGTLFGSQGFILGSTFKPDGSAKDDGPSPATRAGSSFFGTGFSNALGDGHAVTTAASPEADMDADEPEPIPPPKSPPREIPAETIKHFDPQKIPSTTPVSTPAAPRFQQSDSIPVQSSLFGIPSKAESPASGIMNKSAGFNFGTPAPVTETKPVATSSFKTFSMPSFTASSETLKLKAEPQSEEENATILSQIPEAPLPPDTTSKTSYGAGESSVSSIEADAPLSPHFVPQAAGKTTGTDSASPPHSAPPANSEKFTPPTWSKSSTAISSDLIASSDIPGGSGEENYGNDFETEDEDNESHSGGLSEEGSGEDITKDISPISELRQTPGFTPESSFSGLAGRSAVGGGFTKIARPSIESSSRSLFGEIGSRNAPVLLPPKQLTSPRSPSPVRSSVPGRLLRPDPPRSASAPGVASQLLSGRPTSSKTNTFALSLEQRNAEGRHQEKVRARKEADEAQSLIDDEDEKLQIVIRGDIEGTKKLDEFVAHHDYVGNTDKDSIPAQVEAVYRDINSMIDTLGINSHSLKCFIKGHSEQYKDAGRNREDLEGNDEWCLVEAENLSSIITRDLTDQLEQGCVKDVHNKLETCADLEKGIVKLRSRHEDIANFAASSRDPDHLAMVRLQPLTSEQVAQQHDLRRDFTKLQKLLNEAEQRLTLIRAKLASKSGGSRTGEVGPTVEAVTRTILKLTNMAEKRSGDVDFLENQMRKLRFSSVPSSGSREVSPFATPVGKASMRPPGNSTGHGQFYTPDSLKSSSRFHTSVTSSAQSPVRGTPRKKLAGFTEDDKSRLREHEARRKEVTVKLRSALERSGVRVRLMDDA